jgi:ribosomal 30S subunit maturation factor RimM
VGAAYGIRGWIKVHPHADDASALLHARRWWLLRAPPAGVVTAPAQSAEAVSVKIAQSREHSGTVVAQAAGVSDRNVAEMLKGVASGSGVRIFPRRKKVSFTGSTSSVAPWSTSRAKRSAK